MLKLAEGVACAASKEVTKFIAVALSILIGLLNDNSLVLPPFVSPAGSSIVAIVREVPLIVAVIAAVLIQMLTRINQARSL